MSIQRLYVKNNEKKYSILKLIPNPKKQQLVIHIGSKDEHITLHKVDDEILRTHWDPEKPISTWDKKKLDTAKQLPKYKNTFEKHDKYIIHENLKKCDNINEQHIVGRLINLEKFPQPKNRHAKDSIKILESEEKYFFMHICLSKEKNQNTPDSIFFDTNFGRIFCQITSIPKGL